MDSVCAKQALGHDSLSGPLKGSLLIPAILFAGFAFSTRDWLPLVRPVNLMTRVSIEQIHVNKNMHSNHLESSP
jgi:hypothetical protein